MKLYLYLLSERPAAITEWIFIAKQTAMQTGASFLALQAIFTLSWPVRHAGYNTAVGCVTQSATEVNSYSFILSTLHVTSGYCMPELDNIAPSTLHHGTCLLPFL